jgi:hypothetical protein
LLQKKKNEKGPISEYIFAYFFGRPSFVFILNIFTGSKVYKKNKKG